MNVTHEEKQIITAYGLKLSYQHIKTSTICNEVEPRFRIMALHGWLDNCASFTRLAKLIIEQVKQPIELVLLDLPGHGLSDHRHPQATYNLWDDIRDIVDLSNQLDWQTFSLLGHSRGAMISILIAASLPQRIERMILLDGSIPPPVAAQDAPKQLAKHIRDNSRLDASTKRLSYRSLDDAVAARVKATGLPNDAAQLLVERGVRQNNQGQFEWRADSRLRGASAVRLSLEQGKAFLEAIQASTLIIMAKQGLGGDNEHLALLNQYAKLNVEAIEGHHHFHMLEQAGEIADKIITFLVREAKQDA